MPINYNENRLLAYEQERQVMEKALNASKGVEVNFATKGEATRFAMRCNTFRVYMRKAACKGRSQEDPEYGFTPYDGLNVKREDTRVLIYHRGLEELPVREL